MPENPSTDPQAEAAVQTGTRDSIPKWAIGLAPNHRVFVEHYLVTLSYTAAAKAAGYSRARARKTGSELAARPDVARAIGMAMVDVSPLLSKPTLVAELLQIGFSNVANFLRKNAVGDIYIDLSKATREQMAALSSVEVEEFVEGHGEDAHRIRRTKIKLWDKRAALESAGKAMGIFKEHIEVDHTSSDGSMSGISDLDRLKALTNILARIDAKTEAAP